MGAPSGFSSVFGTVSGSALIGFSPAGSFSCAFGAVSGSVLIGFSPAGSFGSPVGASGWPFGPVAGAV